MIVPDFSIRVASTLQEIDACCTLFKEYANELSLDLSFQNFEEELQHLPGEYRAPRGTLLIAFVAHQVAGCCALRPLDTSDYPHSAEIRRLFVKPPFRRLGLGRTLTTKILEFARIATYHSVLLDTLDEMESARTLYHDLGFYEIAPYYHNPLAGAHYLKVDL
jgi:ribosomal protein S18 acetylase RimI-like enzyme